MSAAAPAMEVVHAPGSHWREQAEHFDHVLEPEFELHRPHGESRLYQYLMAFKYRAAVGQLPWPLRGKRAVVVCCGSGMDAEYLERDGATVVGLDISHGALRRAQRRAQLYGLRYGLVQGDAERLPFANGAVDMTYVHDGLHHLERPGKALEEMARVSGLGVVVTEPADAVLTRTAIALRLIPEREDSGNLVARFDAAAMRRQFASMGLSSFRSRRYLLKYGHPPAGWWRRLDWPPLYGAAKGVFLFFGTGLFGLAGNKISAAAFREAATPAHAADDNLSGVNDDI